MRMRNDNHPVEANDVLPDSRPRLRRAVWVLLALLVFGVAAAPPAASPPVATPAPPAPSVMDRPMQLITDAYWSYKEVRDYACLFVKQERVRGQLQPEHLIAMRVRVQPFSVHLRWVGPKQFIGQEAAYVVGRNNGMMRVRSTGLLGVVGFVSLDPRDPRALESSRHTIQEAGIGNLIDQFGRGWELERRLNRTQVHVADYDYNKRKCTRVETIHPDRAGGQLSFYRSIVYFDKENRLPIRVENYDWPAKAGDAPDLAEVFSYVNLRLNVSLPDSTFDR
jgi:hypothetical protein